MITAVAKLKLRTARLLVAAALALSFTPTVFEVSAAQAQAARHTTGRTIVGRVVFEGNKKVKESQLQNAIETRPREPYNQATVQSDVERLKMAYSASGRSTAVITARAVPAGPRTVDVVFTVREGVKIGIDEIRFVGNNTYSAWRLKRQMATVESGYLGFLRSTDTYDPSRMASDAERFRQFYVNHGYPDFRVISIVPELNAEQDAYIITITVEEGAFYGIGASRVESTLPNVNAADYERYVETSPGSTYRGKDVDRTVEDMTIALAKDGYPFAQVRPRGSRAGDAINVDYVIEEGAKVYIERIDIHGNTRTRDYVIRREFDVAEGDPYNKAMIARAERRLRNLGFFQSVSITNRPGSTPDRVIIDVNVVDQSTGELSLGGGYSTSDGIVGEVSLTERNFLGRGQYVKASVKYGQHTQGYELSFTEPYFLGQRIAAGFDIFSTDNDSSRYSSYDLRTTGANLRAAFPITEEFTVGVRYQIYRQRVKYEDCSFNDTTGAFFSPSGNRACDNIDIPGNGELSKAVGQTLGTTTVSMVGYSLTYNSLDDLKNPTEGIYGAFKQDFAGVGGDAKFIRTTVDGRYYYPLTDDFTLMFRGQGGYIKAVSGYQLRIVDHFNPGQNLVRGFAAGGIGPRDGDEALGGSVYYGGTAELQFPIFGLPRELGLSGALFADAGSVINYEGKKCWTTGCLQDFNDEKKLRTSVGASLLWASPLGPLRFDFGVPLTKADGDKTQIISFGTWQTF